MSDLLPGIIFGLRAATTSGFGYRLNGERAATLLEHINQSDARIAMLESQLAAANEWSTEMVTATMELKGLLNGGGYAICREDKDPISLIEGIVVGEILDRITRAMFQHEAIVAQEAGK